VQLARRRWPSAGIRTSRRPAQHEHERHLKAINEAADQLERLAEDSRGGKVTRNAVKVTRRGRAQARARRGARAYEEEQRRAREDGPRQARPVRLARARPLGRAPLRALPVLSRVGRRQRDRASTSPATGDDVQQWARVHFQVGVRTVPAGLAAVRRLLQARPGADRVQRFMTAAKHALAEGTSRSPPAGSSTPATPSRATRRCCGCMTLAFWNAGNFAPRPRGARLGARRGRPPAPHRYAARIYEDMGSLSLAVDAAG
jgi:hypothetical protein